MKNTVSIRRHRAVVVLLILSLSPLASRADESNALAMVEEAMIRLAADRIDSTFEAVAASTRALGDAYRLASSQNEQETPD
ncbi:MAG: hypothetical protein AMJ59_27435, partial [Gammaproteobacteria bacterium SG8_31]